MIISAYPWKDGATQSNVISTYPGFFKVFLWTSTYLPNIKNVGDRSPITVELN